MGHCVTALYTGPTQNFSPKSLPSEYRVEWAKYIGYPITPKMRQLNSVTVYNKLKLIHRKNNFDIINSLGGEALFIPKFCKAAKIPFFVSIAHPFLSAAKINFNSMKPLRILEKIIGARELWICSFACKRANKVITPSIFSKSEAIKYFKLKSSKINVINNGIVDEMFVGSTLPFDRDPLGPFVFFGRLEPQKGVDLLIRAYFKLLKEKVIVDTDLILIGDGPYKEEYRKLVDTLGLKNHVKFKGWKPPKYIKKQLALASLCILPSRTESFGLSIVETLSQGVPLVTTSTASIPEVVDFGKGAWLANSYDIDSLFFNIRKAIENYPESLRKAEHGRRYVRKKFTWEKAAQEYEDLYLENLDYT